MAALWEAAALAVAVGTDDPGVAVTGISIDTRSLQQGDLFVALRADRDGHDFIAEAFARGAAAALVSSDVPAPGPTLRVPDTLRALHRLAAAARARAGAKVIAVTGSVGKTTTKEMLRRMLSAFGSVHAADASFNNHIGVPLTLARLPADAAFAVLEIGMNAPGEIAPLACLARPDVAVITNVERVHLGPLGTEAAIAAEKATILSGLAAGGAAVLPADSPHLATLAAAAPDGVRQLTFGAAGQAARLVSLKGDAAGSDVAALIAGTPVAFRLKAPGRHMAINALAVLAVAQALALDAHAAAAALGGFAAVAGRGRAREIKIPGGTARLLDESYNASGASLRAAFAVLALQPGRHVAALGDILELGAAAAAEHLALRPALLDSADLVFTCGPMMNLLYETLPADRRGASAPDAARLAPRLREALLPGDCVLVKGSNGSRMRDVIAVLDGDA
jgi:UDP-N-acetylmuramoyl-tripeptide--D-alanyl-D-alanine ligase